MNGSSRTIERSLLLFVLALLIVGCFLVLRPFLSSLLWAAIFCFATWPVYFRLERWLHGRRTLAALIMTLLVAGVVIAPLAVIGVSLVDDVKDFAESMRERLSAGPPAPPEWLIRLPIVGPMIGSLWQDFAGGDARLGSALKRVIEPARNWLLIWVVAMAAGLAELAMSVLIGFFLYRDGVFVAGRLTAAIERLAGAEARRLLDIAAATTRGVVYGILGTALAQAVLAGVGLAIAGVPRATLLALLTFFLSVVPAGPPLVWIPAAIWLFYTGSLGWGIFMLAWGVLVSSVDNVIKPLIISQGSNIPFILILLGVLGGVMAFGLIGVFIGPTLLAVGFRLLEQWIASRPRAATDGQQ